MMVVDPVCGMQVDPKTAAASSEYRGETYYFCAPGCKAAFDKDPDRYLSDTSGGHMSHEHGDHHHHSH